MSGNPRLRASVVLATWGCASLLCAQTASKQTPAAAYQSAVGEYNAGRYAEAAHLLEAVLPEAGRSFEVHELLGLAYASLSENAKALNQLQIAVHLQPNSAAARTNLGAGLLKSGQTALAAEQFRRSLQIDPAAYDANHDLGELYIQSGKVAEAVPLLAAAQKADPSSYNNGFDLVMAEFQLGRLGQAKAAAASLLKKHPTGELHDLLGQIDEKSGDYVGAANDYEAAVHLDPSEANLFDWGSEMLLHRTYEPAITIFQDATQRYPNSPRLFIGLGLALYSRGHYDDAVRALLRAADLDPADARCYLFLSKMYDSAPGEAADVTNRFRRYAEEQPNNARAQYYYAISLWKAKRAAGSAADLGTVESLLKKSIALDDSFVDAHLQLGDLFADRHNYDESIPQYERALALDPTLSDAHYRLGIDYVHVGKKELAQKELAVYQQLRAKHLAQVDKERADVRQFVYSAKPPSASTP